MRHTGLVLLSLTAIDAKAAGFREATLREIRGEGGGISRAVRDPFPKVVERVR